MKVSTTQIARTRFDQLAASPIKSQDYGRIIMLSGCRNPNRVLSAKEELARLRHIRRYLPMTDQYPFELAGTISDVIAAFEWITCTSCPYKFTTYLDILIKARS
jgi:hypothetical protein